MSQFRNQKITPPITLAILTSIASIFIAILGWLPSKHNKLADADNASVNATPKTETRVVNHTHGLSEEDWKRLARGA